MSDLEAAGGAMAGFLLSALPEVLRIAYAEQPGVLAVLDLHKLEEKDSAPEVWICDYCYTLANSRSGPFDGGVDPAETLYPCTTIKALAAPFAATRETGQ